ncbi:hypothetical protein PRUPE_1G183100 [Prunus persica]|uniref:Uncharacterized protein n=1 Tax=Prunus persica TaxID=3760 RepID=A0A251QZD8_PRUPE|nr:uncharacterized protein LOC18792841 isoform X2 [Prunus persica]ONI29148.1 hypothetical protein PRUPE_1G183100 [Prunus persica]
MAEPSEHGNRFPGHGRTLVEQEPPRESIKQKLPQVNRQDQGGGGGIRSQIRDNNIMADPNSQNVGASNFHNVQGQGEGQGGGHDICGNTITAREGASSVGFHNFGNTTPGWKCRIL